MSAKSATGKNGPVTESDEQDGDISEEFRDRLLNRYPECDSVADALARAQQEPSTTDADDRARCPACLSVKVGAKTGYDVKQKKPGSRVCTACRAHLQHPAPGSDFDGAARPTAPTAEIVPVTVGSASHYHAADGCEFPGGHVVEVTADAVAARGLDPCAECATAPEECDMCGAPTFGAIEGIEQTVCADCVIVDGTAKITGDALAELRRERLRGEVRR